MDKTRILEFRAYTVFGKCDSVDWGLEVEVKEEEYQRLRDAAKNGDSFYEAKEIKDLYYRVYDKAVEQATADFIENDPEMVEDFLEEDQSIDEWTADEVYEIGVDFPSAWERENL